jgi:preprotein translocase subunit SecA
MVLLQSIDTHWREHLASLDYLRQGIHLRGYAQKNPKQEYKREAFELFSDMLDRIKQDVVKVVLTVTVRSEQDVQAVEEAEPVSNVKYQHAGYDEALVATAPDGDVALAPPPPFTRAGEKVGRNDPCPCGSGKKYKHCHGRI